MADSPSSKILPDESIKRTVDLLIRSEVTGLEQTNKLREEVNKLLKANPELAKSQKGVANAVKEASKSLKEYDTEQKKSIDIVGGLNDRTLKFLGTLGISIATYGQIESTLMGYNKALMDVTGTYRRYSLGADDVEQNTKSLSKQLRITESDYLSLVSSFSESFNNSSISNVNSMLITIRKTVGSDVQAIQKMGSSLSQMANQFPDLEPLLMNFGKLNKVEKDRVAGQTRMLFLTGQISQAQYRQMQEYFNGASKMSVKEKERLKDLQSLKASVEDIQRVLQSAIVGIGKIATPYVDIFRNIFTQIPKLGEIAIGLFVSSTIAKITGMNKIVTPILSAGINKAFGGTLTQGFRSAFSTIEDMTSGMPSRKKTGVSQASEAQASGGMLASGLSFLGLRKKDAFNPKDSGLNKKQLSQLGSMGLAQNNPMVKTRGTGLKTGMRVAGMAGLALAGGNALSGIIGAREGEKLDWKSIGYDILSGGAAFIPGVGPIVSILMGTMKPWFMDIIGSITGLGDGNKNNLSEIMSQDKESQKIQLSERSNRDAKNAFKSSGVSGIQNLISSVDGELKSLKTKYNMSDEAYADKQTEYDKLIAARDSGKLTESAQSEATQRINEIKSLLEPFEKDKEQLELKKSSYEEFLNSQAALLDNKIKAFGDMFSSSIERAKTGIQFNSYAGDNVAGATRDFSVTDTVRGLQEKNQAELARLDMTKSTEERNRQDLQAQRSAKSGRGEDTSELDREIAASSALIDSITMKREAEQKQTNMLYAQPLEALKQTSVIFDRLNTQAATLSEQANFAAMGGDINTGFSLAQKSMDVVRESISESGSQMAALNKAVAEYQKMLAATPNDTANLDKRRGLEGAIREAIREQNELKQRQIGLSKDLIQKALDLANINQPQVEYNTAILGTMQSQFDLVNAIGSGLSVSVSQRMEMVKQMDVGIGLERDRLGILDQEIAKNNQLRNTAPAGSPVAIAAENALLPLLTERQKKMQNILQIQKQQADMTKQLRDGWISAVQASTMGTGLITKFVISQQKNTAIAVQNLGTLQSATSGGKQGGYRESQKFSASGGISERSEADRGNAYEMYGGGLITEKGNYSQQVEDRLRATRPTSMQAASFQDNPNYAGAFVEQAMKQNQIGQQTNQNTQGINSNTSNLKGFLETIIGHLASPPAPAGATTNPARTGPVPFVGPRAANGIYAPATMRGGVVNGKASEGDKYITQVGNRDTLVAGAEVVMNRKQILDLATAGGWTPEQFIDAAKTKTYGALGQKTTNMSYEEWDRSRKDKKTSGPDFSKYRQARAAKAAEIADFLDRQKEARKGPARASFNDGYTERQSEFRDGKRYDTTRIVTPDARLREASTVRTVKVSNPNLNVTRSYKPATAKASGGPIVLNRAGSTRTGNREIPSSNFGFAPGVMGGIDPVAKPTSNTGVTAPVPTVATPITTPSQAPVDSIQMAISGFEKQRNTLQADLDDQLLFLSKMQSTANAQIASQWVSDKIGGSSDLTKSRIALRVQNGRDTWTGLNTAYEALRQNRSPAALEAFNAALANQQQEVGKIKATNGQISDYFSKSGDGDEQFALQSAEGAVGQQKATRARMEREAAALTGGFKFDENDFFKSYSQSYQAEAKGLALQRAAVDESFSSGPVSPKAVNDNMASLSEARESFKQSYSRLKKSPNDEAAQKEMLAAKLALKQRSDNISNQIQESIAHNDQLGLFDVSGKLRAASSETSIASIPPIMDSGSFDGVNQMIASRSKYQAREGAAAAIVNNNARLEEWRNSNPEWVDRKWKSSLAQVAANTPIGQGGPMQIPNFPLGKPSDKILGYANGGIVKDNSHQQQGIRDILGIKKSSMGADTTIAAVSPGERITSNNETNNNMSRAQVTVNINPNITVTVGEELDGLGDKIKMLAMKKINEVFSGPGFR